MQAIILAGGKGTRLKPYTAAIPKPLVPIGEMPILEVVVRQLKYYGVRRVTIAVNHLAELIMAFFGDGRRFGVEIGYSIEDSVLGTAGPLSLVEGLEDDFLVMNGDVLTTVDFHDLYRFHERSANDITIATSVKEVRIDLGVLEISGTDFLEYREKPVYRYDVSTGIYVMKRTTAERIPKAQKMDMPDLVRTTKAAGGKVKCYREPFFWLDIGRPEDYETAQRLFEERPGDFLP